MSVNIQDTVHNRMSHQYSHAKPCHFNLLLPCINNRNQELVHDNCPLCCQSLFAVVCCFHLRFDDNKGMPAHVRRVNTNDTDTRALNPCFLCFIPFFLVLLTHLTLFIPRTPRKSHLTLCKGQQSHDKTTEVESETGGQNDSFWLALPSQVQLPPGWKQFFMLKYKIYKINKDIIT